MFLFNLRPTLTKKFGLDSIFRPNRACASVPIDGGHGYGLAYRLQPTRTAFPHHDHRCNTADEFRLYTVTMGCLSRIHKIYPSRILPLLLLSFPLTHPALPSLHSYPLRSLRSIGSLNPAIRCGERCKVPIAGPG